MKVVEGWRRLQKVEEDGGRLQTVAKGSRRMTVEEGCRRLEKVEKGHVLLPVYYFVIRGSRDLEEVRASLVYPLVSDNRTFTSRPRPLPLPPPRSLFSIAPGRSWSLLLAAACVLQPP